MHHRKWGLAPFLLLMSAAVHAADFDAAGRLTAITHDGTILRILGGFHLDLEDGEYFSIEPSKRARLTRDGDTWRGTVKLPGGSAILEAAWTAIPGKLRFKGSLRTPASKPLAIEGVDYYFHLAHDRFAGGQVLRVQPEDGSSYRPPVSVPVDAFGGSLVNERSYGVTLLDAAKNWSIGIQFPEPRDIIVEEVPSSRTRALAVRIRVHDGPLPADTEVPFAFTLSVVGKAASAPPAAPD
jgi:hypothetical protein